METKNERAFSNVVPEMNGIVNLCFTLSSLESEWKSIVGGSLGARSTLLSYERGVLVVAVDSPSAFQDMNFKKRAIINKICSMVNLVLSDIRVLNGAVRGTDRGPATRRVVFAKRAAGLDERRIKSVSNDILSRHSDMDPSLAGLIARCRVMCER
ncbi:MAG: DUF721 domain-containing protein [Synergistaceae bacterium]|jgi:hypothetical protein|nr:DUF721 domain-containing protein [Synergistaceae bacterium]